MDRWLVKVLVAGLIAVSSMTWGSAHAGACTVLTDGLGDTSALSDLAGPPLSAGGENVDIAGVDFAYDGVRVTVTLRVADLDGPSDAITDSAHYGVSWDARGRNYRLGAERLEGNWAFEGVRIVPSGLVGIGDYIAVTGDVDAARDTVTWTFDRSSMTDVEDGDRLDQLFASSSQHRRIWTGRGYANGFDRLDRAPNAGTQSGFTLEPTACEPQGAAVPTATAGCHVAFDLAGDALGVEGLDLLGVDLGADDGWLAITARMRPDGMTENAARATQRMKVVVSWEAGGRTARAVARIDATFWGFTVDSGDRVSTVPGGFDQDDKVFRWSVPRALLGADDGAELQNVRAESFRLHQNGAESIDRTDDEGTFVVGPGCGGNPPVLRCPLVVDPSGDGGIHSVGPDDPSLDIVSVGAQTIGDAIRLSARVADLTQPPSPIWDKSGVVVSWFLDGKRWAGQAMRRADGTNEFFYHSDQGSMRAPSGASFRGTPTTGVIDATTGVYAIDLPRGALAVGAVLYGVGATSFGMEDKEVTASITHADRTGVAPYIVGEDCPATA